MRYGRLWVAAALPASAGAGSARDSAATGHSLVFAGGTWLLFGGERLDEGRDLLDDLFAVEFRADEVSFTRIAPSTAKGDAEEAEPPLWPSGRRWHAAVGTGSRMLLFGGRTAAALSNEAWLFHPRTGAWSLLEAEGLPAAEGEEPAQPAPREGCAGAYLPRASAAVFVGGFDGAHLRDDVLLLDLVSAWRGLGAVPFSPVLPSLAPARGR